MTKAYHEAFTKGKNLSCYILVVIAVNIAEIEPLLLNYVQKPKSKFIILTFIVKNMAIIANIILKQLM